MTPSLADPRTLSRAWFATGLGVVLVAPPVLEAQLLHIRVIDGRGDPVPFAVVTAAPGGTRSADFAGHVTFRMPTRGDIHLRARRLGYTSAERTVRLGDTVVVQMRAVARTLSSVEVTERATSPLVRSGFYDRMQRDAIVGDFIWRPDVDRSSGLVLFERPSRRGR